MKKFLIYTLAFAMGLSLTSCKDFLEEKAYGNPTSEELLQDPDNMALLVGQAYAEMKWLHDHWGYWGLNTLTSDEARCPVRQPGNHWDDNGYWVALNTMKWNYEGLAFELVWDKNVAGATLCNKILKQISAYEDVVDAKMYARFVAELCVLRSYYYYTMFDLFGRIPYTEEFPESETAQFPLLEKAQVWHKLVDCLEKHTPNLPTADNPSKAQNYGRATQGLGYALLARLYLNAQSYDVTDVADPYAKCVQYCDAVINSGAYTIEDNFFNNFLFYNENSQENIFVIVENGNASFDYQDVAGKMCNKLRINLLTQHYAFISLYGLLEKPWNGFAASAAFLSLYKDGDRRGPCPENAGTDIDFQDKDKKYGWFLGPVKDANGNIVKDENGNEVIIVNGFKGGAKNASWNEGARCFKYETEINSTVNKFSENDFVLFRYADVLYMKAEACLRGGGDVSSVLGMADFQRIRERAGLQPYTSLTLNEILDERGREFAWENVRRRDLIRFDKYTGNAYLWDFKEPGVEPFRKWFPIPKKFLEIHANDRIPWTQNEGY
ncbi:MAG: RagB/SusD family nutrient uptake outer membrane protein [Paludibacteraceae bacterium]|nr:RagB/SusD family nutrient uptake outer membrane protein [Paludibacteraceae bacterium]